MQEPRHTLVNGANHENIGINGGLVQQAVSSIQQQPVDPNHRSRRIIQRRAVPRGSRNNRKRSNEETSNENPTNTTIQPNITIIPESSISSGSSLSDTIHSGSASSVNSLASNPAIPNQTEVSAVISENSMFQRVEQSVHSRLRSQSSVPSRAPPPLPETTSNGSKLSPIMTTHPSTKPNTSTVNNYNNHAIIVAQFCEQKGPSFVYCTQMINHVHAIEDLDNYIMEHVNNEAFLNSPQTLSSLTSKDLLSKLHSLHPHLFASTLHYHSFTTNGTSILEPVHIDHFNQFLMLSTIEQITLDKESQKLFVSSHQESNMFSAHFKTLAIKSTSAEISVGQGREGPVLFGDEINGYNFAYVFKVKDSMARGFARWFAFVFMDTSLSMLAISWPFLKSGFGKIIKLIKTRSQQIFLEEKERQKRSGSSNALNEDGTNSEDNGYRFFHSGGPLSADLFRQKRSKGPMRDLPILLQYEDFYSDLHASFSGLIKSFYDKISEIVPPPLSVDRIVIQPKTCQQPELKEDILRIQSFSSIVSEASDWTYTALDCLSDFSNIVKRCLTRQLMGDVSIATVTQAIDLVDSADITDDIFNQSEDIIKKIIYHVIVGNQLIVRSDNIDLANQICSLFMSLIPTLCIQSCLNSDYYRMPYEANFITLDNTVQVPEDSIDFKFVILVDVMGSLDNLESITIKTDEDCKETTLGKELEKLFFQQVFYQIQQYNTVKITRSQVIELERTLLTNLKHEWTSKAKFFVTALKHGGQMEKVTSIVNAPLENDISVLKYFASCLPRLGSH